MSERVVRLEQVVRPLLEEGRTVRITPHGTSMLPMLMGGRDQVILTPVTGPLKKYDLPLYQRDSGQYVLHRIVGVGETYTCIGDNQYALEHGVRPDQVLAVVSGFTRKGREYSVEDGSYRLYCRLWHWSRPARRLVWYGARLVRAVCRRVSGKSARSGEG